MKTSWRIELPQLLLIAAMFAAAGICWTSAPDAMPVHWNTAGEVDRHGGKVEGLLLVPLITVGLYLLLRYLPRLDPGYANYKYFASAYHVIRISLVVYMATIHGAAILAAFGYPGVLPQLIPVMIGVLFVVFGNVMGKIRPNWFVGIRTPWTLSSKRSWAKTHRLGGWLFIATGILVLLAGLVQTSWAIWVTLGLSAFSVVTVFVYSYFVWRNDPQRVAPAGSAPVEN